MLMKSLEINNFRCFNQFSIDFAPNVTLIIGDNASGKTSLLMAVKYAMNCFFSGFSDLYTSWKTPGVNDFSKITFNEKKRSSLPIQINFSFYENDFDLNIPSPADINLTLFKKDEKSRPLVSRLYPLKDYGKFLLQDFLKTDEDGIHVSQQYALPLFASFSTHGIHKKVKINTKYFLEYKQSPSFGYYLCSDTDGLTDHWVKRFLALTEANQNPLERNVVMDALYRMFGKDGCDLMTDFQPRIISKYIYCTLCDGREIPSALLSDGYKRLFSIAIDLAFRCALLNGDIYGENAALLTRGTVIIDEIDLHLHPSLQAVVIKGLRNAFPNIQFIVSTHAPMVMSGVESDARNHVKYMEYDSQNHKYSVEDISTYGMDISTIAKVVLKQSPRVSDVESSLSLLSNLISENNLDEAKELLSKLKIIFGDRIPELSSFETEINFEETLR